MSDDSRSGAPAVMLLCDYSLHYLGGAQTAFMRQARSLAAEGWKVVVVAPDSDVLAGTPGILIASPVVRRTFPVLDLPILGDRSRLQADVAVMARRHRVRALVVHSEFTLAAVALGVGAELGIPVLHTVHTFFWHAPIILSPFAPGIRWFHRRLTGIPSVDRCHGGTPVDNALRGMTLRVALRADGVLSPSEHQARALRAAGVASARAFSNVSEPLQPAPLRRCGPLTLVWAARFAPEKRLQVALDAVRLVTARLGPGRVHLHVAGGRHRAQTDVTFHGRVPATRVAELMTRSDAVLITSFGFDNQPMIALEGFTRARPVIVSDPALAAEFGAAAIGTVTPDAAGLADTLTGLVADRGALTDAAAAALAYARARRPAAHAADLRAAIDGVSANRRA
ncbi:glycosyltransferase family 4 protein [Microbacterium terrisoli]|uniref:glycosyltransferase family 4 protein n=1 Tax=Microbacterium terrisoli TaxID=3242192 RepID=UPI002805E6B2|nr:glycosyltransferase family 4 protein [Microbacterium protaetiae]